MIFKWICLIFITMARSRISHRNGSLRVGRGLDPWRGSTPSTEKPRWRVCVQDEVVMNVARMQRWRGGSKPPIDIFSEWRALAKVTKNGSP